VAQLQGLIWKFDSVGIKSNNLNFLDFHKNKNKRALTHTAMEFD
jgi:hypothetical protein